MLDVLPRSLGPEPGGKGSGLIMFESPSQRLRLNPHHTTGWGGAPLLLREGRPALSQDAARQRAVLAPDTGLLLSGEVGFLDLG